SRDWSSDVCSSDLDANSTGPALRGVVERHPTDWLHKWIKDSSGLIKSGDAAAVKLFNEWKKVPMNSFPNLSDEDIDNIIAYTSTEKEKPEVPVGPAAGGAEASGGIYQTVVLAGLVVVLAMLVVMLISVRRVLNKVANKNNLTTTEKKCMPIWKAFVRNQFLVITAVIVLLLSGAYFAFGFM